MIRFLEELSALVSLALFLSVLVMWVIIFQYVQFGN